MIRKINFNMIDDRRSASARWLPPLFAAVALTACGPDKDQWAPPEQVFQAVDSDFESAGELGRLGRAIFTDTTLSNPAGQSCASCHTPQLAYTAPFTGTPSSEGAVRGRFGPRNAPTAAYAQFSPVLSWDADDGTWVGGQFLDGRADTLEEQATQPFQNPVEMNMSPDEFLYAISRAPYAPALRRVLGGEVLDTPQQALQAAGKAIAAFERTSPFGLFTSKYDAYLNGEATLSDAEARGLALFEAEDKGNCAACHPSQPGPDGEPPLFTDFTYDNLGIPANPGSRFYDQPTAFNPAGPAYKDLGLGAVTGDPAQNGKFKVPTLRNVALTAPYTHNGYFTDLRSLVDFYNTRDVKPWPAAEVPETVNHDELGNLRLTPDEVDDLVAFLGTLTDGYGRLR